MSKAKADEAKKPDYDNTAASVVDADFETVEDGGRAILRKTVVHSNEKIGSTVIESY